MLLTHTILLLVTLAYTTFAGTVKRRSSCSEPAGTKFLIYYTNGTSPPLYGALGHPCTARGGCEVFFSVNRAGIQSQYSLTSNGSLAIAANGPSSPAVGFLADGNVQFSGHPRPNPVVSFDTTEYTDGMYKQYKALKCSIEASADGDGTCDLLCSVTRGVFTSQGYSVDIEDNNLWYLGRQPHDITGERFVSVQVKAEFL